MIWGVGPSLTVPTATDDSLGSEKWSAGPAAVALAMPGNWVVGTLIRQLWSFAGDDDRQDVNQTLIQPFVNYNFPGGWYAVSSPIITANWEASSDDTWTVPVGGGLGKIFRIGGQAMNAQLQGFYNVERPEYGPDWLDPVPAPVPVPEVDMRRCRCPRPQAHGHRCGPPPPPTAPDFLIAHGGPF